MLHIPVFHSDAENEGKHRQRERPVLFSVCRSQGSLTELHEMELSPSACWQKGPQQSSKATSNSAVPLKEPWESGEDHRFGSRPTLLFGKDLDIMNPQFSHL